MTINPTKSKNQFRRWPCLGKKRLLTLSLMLVAPWLATPTAVATTTNPMTLAEIKEASEAIVMGQVRNLTYFTRGSEIRTRPPETGEPPATEQKPMERDEEVRPGIDRTEVRPLPSGSLNSHLDLTPKPGRPNPADTTLRPVGADTEGGLMPYTFVEFFIHDMRGHLEGSGPGQSYIYLVAGGQLRDLETRVMGIPQLEIGQSYILFLCPQLTNTAVPYMGLERGVFPIERDEATGRAIVTDASGRPVIAIEDGEIVVRASEEDLKDFKEAWTSAPSTNDEGTRVSSDLPNSRFWSSREPALSASEFMARVDRL